MFGIVQRCTVPDWRGWDIHSAGPPPKSSSYLERGKLKMSSGELLWVLLHHFSCRALVAGVGFDIQHTVPLVFVCLGTCMCQKCAKSLNFLKHDAEICFPNLCKEDFRQLEGGGVRFSCWKVNWWSYYCHAVRDSAFSLFLYMHIKILSFNMLCL